MERINKHLREESIKQFQDRLKALETRHIIEQKKLRNIVPPKKQ